MVVLRLYPIQHQATGQLGPIRLVGYELESHDVSAGATIPFHLYWQAEAATATNYQVFNHLLDAEGNLVAQIDGPPLPDPLLRRGTMDWDDPEEIIYSREYALALPEDLPPGEYTIVTGFYRRDNGQRLLTPTGEDALWVTRVSVEAVSGESMASSDICTEARWRATVLAAAQVVAGAAGDSGAGRRVAVSRVMISVCRMLTNPMKSISPFLGK